MKEENGQWSATVSEFSPTSFWGKNQRARNESRLRGHTQAPCACYTRWDNPSMPSRRENGDLRRRSLFHFDIDRDPRFHPGSWASTTTSACSRQAVVLAASYIDARPRAKADAACRMVREEGTCLKKNLPPAFPGKLRRRGISAKLWRGRTARYARTPALPGRTLSGIGPGARRHNGAVRRRRFRPACSTRHEIRRPVERPAHTAALNEEILQRRPCSRACPPSNDADFAPVCPQRRGPPEFPARRKSHSSRPRRDATSRAGPREAFRGRG